MAQVAQPATRFDIFNDSSFTSDGESDQSSIDHGNSSLAPLNSISVSNIQNRQSEAPGPGRIVDSLAAELEKLHIGGHHEISQFKGKPVANPNARSRSGSRLSRSSIARNSIEVLETVPEDDKQDPSISGAVSVSGHCRHYIEVPADQYTQHPLALAARNLPSAEEQLAKHIKGDFEWVLTVRVPKQSSSDTISAQADSTGSLKTHRVYFGCNLVPGKTQHEVGNNPAGGAYTLLVTPLEGNKELEDATALPDNEENMALSADINQLSTPAKLFGSQPEGKVEEQSLALPTAMSLAEESFIETITSRSPAKHIARIEDSVEALDKLEEQLEAFDVAAAMRDLASQDVGRSTAKPLPRILSPNTTQSRGPTPQPRKVGPKAGASTLQINTRPSMRSPNSRRPASMMCMEPPKLLDSPKLKVEDKALVQAPLKKSSAKPLTSLLPPKQPAKSTKPLTVSTFELPGEAVARRLKEKREARLSMAASIEKPQAPATLSVRRTKSVKAPTRPTFELPGEAISRRKREERDARLKAQEEEERKRREFKARPVRVASVRSSVPRDTATSRARQNKGPVSENAPQGSPNTNKRVSIIVSREPLTSTSNQSPSRGRNPTTESSQVSRATSSSNGSISGKRSSVSMEDAQAQRLRGREILRRDSMFAQDRQREKREREALARLAREQAAERSRQLSRAWAEKQRQKRMTIGSLQDAIASSS